MKPAFAIELDDRSHLKIENQMRDRIKDNACQKAGFPLLRYNYYSVHVVRGLCIPSPAQRKYELIPKTACDT